MAGGAMKDIKVAVVVKVKHLRVGDLILQLFDQSALPERVTHIDDEVGYGGPPESEIYTEVGSVRLRHGDRVVVMR